MNIEDLYESAEQLSLALKTDGEVRCVRPCHMCDYYFLDRDNEYKCFADSLAYYITYQKGKNL